MVSHIVAITRLNKPVGSLLLAWPVCWALWLATGGTPELSLLAIFGAGVLLMRSAGCVINDIMDRRFDAQVRRTTLRPLASGVMSVKAAWILLATLLLMAACLLVFLNARTQVIALLAAGMTLLYPLGKRFTYLPQLILGMTFNMGVLMVYTQIQGQIPTQAWLLYTASVCWTLAYDTVYALQDKEDDLCIGVKSTAILVGRYHMLFVSLWYAVFLFLFYQAVTPNFMTIIAIVFVLISLLQSLRQQYHEAFLTNISLGGVLLINVIMLLY